MFKSWRLGTALGFPIDVNTSFLFLLGFVFFAYGGVSGLIVTAIAFASIVLHELGHAAVARSRGVHVSGIELGFFGGAAKMTVPRSARDELLIAAAGPAVSLALGGAAIGVAALTHLPMLALIGWINLVIAGFNLIPALPMDGGRILRAALSRPLGHFRATEIAIKVARVTAVAFVVVGLSIGSFQLVLLAPFLWMMGSQELAIARAGSPTSSQRFATGMRRFAIRNVNGRRVIVAVD